MVIALWALKAPGGNALFSAPGYASAISYILQSGHLTFLKFGDFKQAYPSMYLIASLLTSTTGLSLGSALALLDIFNATLVGLFYFFIIGSFVSSPRLVAAATMLSIVADEQLVNTSPFNIRFYGLIFFLVMMVLLTSFPSNQGHFPTWPFLVVSMASVLAYPMIAFMIILMTVFSFARKSIAFPSRKLFAVLVVSYASWTVYVSQFIYTGLSVMNNIFFSLFGVPSAAPSGTPHGLVYQLSRLLLSSVSALPYGLGYLIPAWFLAFFGVGAMTWIGLKLLRSKKAPFAFIMIPLFITGTVLFLLPGGAEWPRILVYIAPFIGASIFVALEHRGPLVTIIVVGTLLLTLPTVVAYYPLVGVYGAHYPSQYSAGNYVSSYARSGPIYIGSGIQTLVDFSLYTRIVSGLSPAPLTPTQAQDSLMSGLSSFKSSTTASLLTVDPLFFKAYSHYYGDESSIVAYQLVRNYTASLSQVYSNGYTEIYWND